MPKWNARNINVTAAERKQIQSTITDRKISRLFRLSEKLLKLYSESDGINAGTAGKDFMKIIPFFQDITE